MNKTLSLMIVGLLVLSGFGAAATLNRNTDERISIKTIIFSKPVLHEQNGYISVTMDNMNSWVKTPGRPMLPAYIEVFVFPFGTKIKKVDVAFSKPKNMMLHGKVIPAPKPVPLTEAGDTACTYANQNVDEVLYSTDDFYPQNQFTYSVSSGLKNNIHSMFLVVRCYPIRYIPARNVLFYSDRVEISVMYEEPVASAVFPDEYDMVVIAPSRFSKALQPLIEHKNNHGINTTLKTVEEIYQEYEGRDKPEQIKYFIKDALDNWGIKYVLLVGGLKSVFFGKPRDDCNQGSRSWYVPVRYTNLKDEGSIYDPGYISDLYYADIYDGENNFSSWDSNGDGIYAMWSNQVGKKDIIDLYPDVYVGRLPCRNTLEVKIMVNKIINYEKNKADQSWFNKMVVIGGDTFNDVSSTNYYEGEVENQKALDYMDGFTPIRIWASNRDTGGLVPIPRDIIRAVSRGCGFLMFSGHGSPERWNTYWPEAFDEERAKGLWYYNIPALFNGGKLPVCVVGGCHNSQFNVTATSFLLDGLWVYGPVPECFSWWLTRKIGGGCIATLGNTGLGYGTVGNYGDLDGDGVDEPDCVEALGGYLDTQFFKTYGVYNVSVLGEIWGDTISNYLNVFPGMEDKIDCKTVEQWVLLGDPSLKIGGY